MARLGHNFYLVLILCIGLLFIRSSQAEAINTGMLEWENSTTFRNMSFLSAIGEIADLIWDCLVADVMFNTSVLSNNCIPRLISQNMQEDCSGYPSYSYAAGVFTPSQTGGAGSTISDMLSGLWHFVWAIASGEVFYIAMVNGCINSFVVSPAEYINIQNGNMDCTMTNGVIQNTAINAITEMDVPFFYNCNSPGPRLAGYSNDQEVLENIDNLYGNMNDPSFPYCTKGMQQYANASMVGSVVLREANLWSVIMGTRGLCNSGKTDQQAIFTLEDTRQYIVKKTSSYLGSSRPLCIPELYYISYYDVINGQIMLCVAIIATPSLVAFIAECGYDAIYDLIFNNGNTNKPPKYSSPDGSGIEASNLSPPGNFIDVALYDFAIFPIIVGGTAIPPPVDYSLFTHHGKGNNLAKLINGTRCDYFMLGRLDLTTLGIALTQSVGQYNSVASFLVSDWHPVSTVFGCIQDVLTQVFVNPAQDGNYSLFAQVQSGMKGLVLVLLAAYVSMLGFKMMTAAQAPSMGEWALYLLKSVLVVYFCTSDVWSHGYNGDRNQPGLYQVMLTTVSDVCNIFMQAVNSSDPIGMCTYNYNGQNILSQRNIPISEFGRGILPTHSPYNLTKSDVLLTVWDLLDCKIANYLNFNSCQYTLGGMVIFWLVGLGLSCLPGWLLAIAGIIYLQALFKVVFRFVHITILAIFSITILVMISPIIIPMVFFDYTKESFSNWAKAMIGYLLYPGFTFAFLALMLATFDSIFYGPLNIPPGTQSFNLQTVCTGIDSVYCTFMTLAYPNATTIDATNCTQTIGYFFSTFASSDTSWLGINQYVLSNDVISNLSPSILKLALFSILFHLLSNSILSFIETLLSIYGNLQGMSAGSINFVSTASSGLKKGAKVAMTKARIAYRGYKTYRAAAGGVRRRLGLSRAEEKKRD